MKHTINKSRSAIGVALALALLTSITVGAQTTTTFNLTGVQGESLAGVYTSPYLGNVGGTPDPNSNPATTIPVICDDFSDNSYLPESWTANVTTLATIDSSSSPLSYLKWNRANSGAGATSGGSITIDSTSYAGWDLTQSQAYTVAAILTLDILKLNNPTDPLSPNSNNADPTAAQQQEDYSFALWELFDPNAAAGALVTAPSPGDANWGTNSDSVIPWLGTSYVSDLTNATVDLENAIYHTNQSVLNGYAATIYSYNGPPEGKGPSPSCGSPLAQPCPSVPPQEFITLSKSPGTMYPNHPVPEPSSLNVWGGYFLFGGVSLLFWGRRRLLS